MHSLSLVAKQTACTPSYLIKCPCVQDLSPAGCSAKALAEGSELLEPSSGPVVRQESVTFSADAVRRELGDQGTPVPSLVRKPAMMFQEMNKKESRDDLPAKLPATRTPASKRQVASWT